ncbi:MAG: transporter permease [Firmicutes bacterium]|nr:transporter permease [Bacillota bacterium]
MSDERITVGARERAALIGEADGERRPATQLWKRLSRLDAWALPVAALAVWEVLSRLGLISPFLMPAPSTILGTLSDLAASGTLMQHLQASLVRVTIGFLLGTLLALPLATLVGLSRPVERLLDPTIQALRSIPSLAWVPLLLLWMGIDEAPKLTLIAIGAFFPIYMNAVAGIRGVDRKLVEIGQVYRFSPLKLARRIIIPAALPSLLTGLRLGLGMSWLYLVAAELIAATRGIGYMLSDGRETSRPDIVLGAILLLAALGKLSDGLLKWLEGRLLRWRDSFTGGDANASD